MVKKNTCVFISGQGTNLKNLILRSRENNFPINIKLIISNKKNASGIIFAKKNSIPFMIVNTKLRSNDNEILQILKRNKISFICLAGYMKIISKNFIKKFGKKIINIQPSLLPKFKGLNTFSRVLKNNEKKTGCTVHYVNEKLDCGNIIAQKSFYIDSNDNEKTLKWKTQKLEYQVFPEAIIKILKIFKWLKSKNISDKEMMQTFNCGIGFCLIVPKNNISKIKKVFSQRYQPYEIGFISKTKKKFTLSKSLKW